MVLRSVFMLLLGATSLLAQNDNSATNAASVRITQPFEGQEFSPGGWRRIEIVAEAFHPDYTVREFEIFSGTNLIREIYVSWNLSPNEPTQMSFLWDAPEGRHTLTVRAAGLVSEPVNITVDANARPTVSALYYRWGTETVPYADYAGGYFWVERTERIDESLTVFFDIGGTATPGVDYIPLANSVTFEPGHPVAVVLLEAVDDEAMEGDESVILELKPPPPGTVSEHPTDYLIDVSTAVGTIFDNEGTNAAPHLEILSPEPRQLLEQGKDIEFKVIARDPKGYIPRVQLFLGTLRDDSIVTFETPPAPGTPIEHTLVFSNAPARQQSYYATLVGFDPNGNLIATNIINFAVGPNPDRVTLGLSTYGGEVAERLTNGFPSPGAFTVHRVFGPTNQPVQFQLQVAGTAENGVDYKPIGISGTLNAGFGSTNIVIEPIPDELVEGYETIVVSLVDPNCWTTNPAPATTNVTCYMVSTNSELTFMVQDAPPSNVSGVKLSLEVADSIGREIPINGELDTIVFRVRRVAGPIDEEVEFAFMLSGEAWNGTDYERLPELMTMAPNQGYADVVVRPIEDHDGDGNERVIFTLIDFNCGTTNKTQSVSALGQTRLPSCYDVIGTNIAEAIILHDRGITNLPPRVTILSPHDGAVFEAGATFQIRTESYDLKFGLISVDLWMNDIAIGGINPVFPLGTNFTWSSGILTLTTNAPVGEHSFRAASLNTAGLVGYSSTIRILIRDIGATNHAGGIPISLDEPQWRSDGKVALKLRGNNGQVCNLQRSENLVNWRHVTKVFLPGGELEFIDVNSNGAACFYRLVGE